MPLLGKRKYINDKIEKLINKLDLLVEMNIINDYFILILSYLFPNFLNSFKHICIYKYFFVQIGK